MIFNSRTMSSRDYDEYKESGSWKCQESPTGAHHWIIKDKKAKCDYCSEIRKLDEKGQIVVNDNQEL